MQVTEFVDAKKELEKNLRNLIVDRIIKFETETGIKVKDIELSYTPVFANGRPVLFQVKVNLDL